MNPASDRERAALALEERIDQVCAPFEAACKAALQGGLWPRIEEHVAAVPPPQRRALLCELILLDLHYRQRDGQTPQADRYQARFPEFDPAWLAQAGSESPPREGSSPPTGAASMAGRWPGGVSPTQVAFPRFGSPNRESVVGGADAAPRRLGEYVLLREVGRGGMGVVYEAVQESLGRHVALKVLPFHPLLDAPHLERFRREARAAAKLHHTNIVPVFGVGAHEGLHYYAMQYIEGQSLDRVLQAIKGLGEANGTRTEDPLIVQVADNFLRGQFAPAALEQASAQETITRLDAAAPSAEAIGEDPAPAASSSGTIRDSGAKRFQPLGSAYFRTCARLGLQVAEALGHAHRQGILHRDIKPSNLLLDTAGTVWVTDFGLAKAEGSAALTQNGDIVGTLPYMAPERFQGRSDPRSDVYSLGLTLYEMVTLRPAFADADRARLLDRVQHETPPAPCKLKSQLPRDLDTIIRKASAREPHARYATAEALAEDLRRFLADRPIEARRSTVLEHTWRWCRRNPALAGVTAALAVVLVAGLIGMTSLWWRADSLRQLAETKKIEAQNHLQEANANFDLARQVVDRCFTVASQNPLLQKAGMQPVRALLLGAALEYYQSFLEKRGEDPVVLEELANNYVRVATITDLIGSKAKALEAWQQACLLQEKLVSASPPDHRAQEALAVTYGALAELQLATGKREVALETYEKARRLREALLRADPKFEHQHGMAKLYHDLGSVQYDRGQIPAAIQNFQQGVQILDALVEGSPEVTGYQATLARILSNLGLAQQAAGDRAAALGSYQRAVRVNERVLTIDPDAADVQYALAVLHSNIGTLQEFDHDLEADLRSHQKAYLRMARLVQANPDVILYRVTLAHMSRKLGDAFEDHGDFGGALYLHEEAQAILEKLTQDEPPVTEYQWNLARTRANIGALRRRAGQLTEALQAFAGAHTILTQLVAANPAVAKYQYDLANTHNFIGRVQHSLQHAGEAFEAYEEARRLFTKLVQASPKDTNYLGELARTYMYRAVLQRDEDQSAEALESLLEARAIWTQMIQANSTLNRYHQNLAETLCEIGNVQADLNEGESALSSFQQARTLAEKFVEAKPEVPEYHSVLGGICNDQGLTLERLHRLAEAIDCYRRAVREQRLARGKVPQSAHFKRLLRTHYEHLAAALQALGETDEAASVRAEQQGLGLCP